MPEDNDIQISGEILKFPKNFLFGTAAASFQVEKPDSQRNTDWDTFIRNHPEKEIIKPGEIGPDWYNLKNAEHDINLVTGLGINSMRVSIEWARIFPSEDTTNRDALTYYQNLVDYIQNQKLTPVLTIQHFTLPDWIARTGGWSNRKILKWYETYTKLLIKFFPDVNWWITINEPNLLVQLGYLAGFFPPNRHNPIAALLARHNMLRANQIAYNLIKEKNSKNMSGIAHSLRWYRPEKADVIGEKLYTRVVDWFDSTNYIEASNKYADFIGANFYTGYYLDLNPRKLKRTMRKEAETMPDTFLFGQTKKPDAYITEMGWPIVPDFFYSFLKNIWGSYHKPIFITENGLADGNDKYRAFYILTHLVALWKAMQEGTQVPGYMYWSAVDNLEWLYGFDKRFGLIKVDHKNTKREIRPSAHLYRDIAKSKEINVDKLIEKYIPNDQKTTAKKAVTEILTATTHTPRLRLRNSYNT